MSCPANQQAVEESKVLKQDQPTQGALQLNAEQEPEVQIVIINGLEEEEEEAEETGQFLIGDLVLKFMLWSVVGAGVVGVVGPVVEAFFSGEGNSEDMDMCLNGTSADIDFM